MRRKALALCAALLATVSFAQDPALTIYCDIAQPQREFKVRTASGSTPTVRAYTLNDASPWYGLTNGNWGGTFFYYGTNWAATSFVAVASSETSSNYVDFSFTVGQTATSGTYVAQVVITNDAATKVHRFGPGKIELDYVPPLLYGGIGLDLSSGYDGLDARITANTDAIAALESTTTDTWADSNNVWYGVNTYSNEVLPGASNAYNMGSFDLPWATGYFHTVVVDTNTILSTDGTRLQLYGGQLLVGDDVTPPAAGMYAGDNVSDLVNDAGYFTNNKVNARLFGPFYVRPNTVLASSIVFEDAGGVSMGEVLAAGSTLNLTASGANNLSLSGSRLVLGSLGAGEPVQVNDYVDMTGLAISNLADGTLSSHAATWGQVQGAGFLTNNTVDARLLGPFYLRPSFVGANSLVLEDAAGVTMGQVLCQGNTIAVSASGANDLVLSGSTLTLQSSGTGNPVDIQDYVDMNGLSISNMADAVEDSEAATWGQVQAHNGAANWWTNPPTAALDMNGQNITDAGAITANEVNGVQDYKGSAGNNTTYQSANARYSGFFGGNGELANDPYLILYDNAHATKPKEAELTAGDLLITVDNGAKLTGGPLDMSANQITNLSDGVESKDAVNYGQVEPLSYDENSFRWDDIDAVGSAFAPYAAGYRLTDNQDVRVTYFMERPENLDTNENVGVHFAAWPNEAALGVGDTGVVWRLDIRFVDPGESINAVSPDATFTITNYFDSTAQYTSQKFTIEGPGTLWAKEFALLELTCVGTDPAATFDRRLGLQYNATIHFKREF